MPTHSDQDVQPDLPCTIRRMEIACRQILGDTDVPSTTRNHAEILYGIARAAITQILFDLGPQNTAVIVAVAHFSMATIRLILSGQVEEGTVTAHASSIRGLLDCLRLEELPSPQAPLAGSTDPDELPVRHFDLGPTALSDLRSETMDLRDERVAIDAGMPNSPQGARRLAAWQELQAVISLLAADGYRTQPLPLSV